MLEVSQGARYIAHVVDKHVSHLESCGAVNCEPKGWVHLIATTHDPLCGIITEVQWQILLLLVYVVWSWKTIDTCYIF